MILSQFDRRSCLSTLGHTTSTSQRRSTAHQVIRNRSSRVPKCSGNKLSHPDILQFDNGKENGMRQYLFAAAFVSAKWASVFRPVQLAEVSRSESLTSIGPLIGTARP